MLHLSALVCKIGCARGGIRTHTLSRAMVLKTIVSTSSTTRAQKMEARAGFEPALRASANQDFGPETFPCKGSALTRLRYLASETNQPGSVIRLFRVFFYFFCIFRCVVYCFLARHCEQHALANHAIDFSGEFLALYYLASLPVQGNN